MFFDPNTDIRKVLPMILDAVLDGMRDTATETELQKIDYLSACVRVFEIRLVEDNLPLDEQLQKFWFALPKIGQAVLHTFFRRLSVAMLMTFGMFCRRDSATDKDVLRSFMENIRQSALKERLSPSTYAQVKNELKTGDSLLLGRTQEDVAALELGTGDEIDGLKRIAKSCVQAGPDLTWDELAELCDKEFSAGRRSDAEQIALALAYPTYKQPTLGVEAENGSEDEAGPAEAPEQPGAVPLDSGTDESRQ